MNVFDLKGSYQYYLAEDFIPPFCRPNKRVGCVVDKVCSAYEAVKNKIIDVYGKDTTVRYFADGKTFDCVAADLPVCESVYIEEEKNVVNRKRFDFTDLEEIMKRLRADDGCEWDKAQTYDSLRSNVLEEACELIEGMEQHDAEKMLEEAGDVILQSAFVSEIAEENGSFDWTDVLTALCRKLLDRHTHIFGSDHANNAEEALAFWTEAKKKEKQYVNGTDQMDRVPLNFPALSYAEKIQKIAKKNGFDWDTVDGAVEKVNEELQELLSATPENREEEGGDLLFAVVNVLRFFKINPEMALHDANLKFKERFAEVERLATANGKEMKDYTLSELDEFWNQAKKTCRR